MKLITTLVTAGMLTLSGCASQVTSYDHLEGAPATLTPRTATYDDLKSLPAPSSRILAAVYDFRDQTGQYRPQPASTFSTAVTQGGAAMLSSALAESGWFIPLERVGLQNLLTERRIIRANLERMGRENELSSLNAARVLLEGGIIAYDSNMKTGGIGAEYFGIGASGEYQVDQVTINLRAVDIATGEVLGNVTTSKTIYSHELRAGVYRFVSFQRLLEAEAGFTHNEPVQMAVMSAVESAVIHLITQGVDRGLWSLANPEDADHEVLAAYRDETVPML
ncbi:curli production assembly/transport protein CsgG [Halomonas sp. KAO]|uniref:CsgG/HfaB family protein n=1 Tax=unclassified Halomonas TaxID=2609666 RepID=UPI00189C5AC6|nr:MULTISPECIES: CsgG/HfaB family protein [unclassified Halomonas]MBF7053188.1 curli production assembly/transport protein CsgG [Halomonas sp. KAO]MDT0499423.1 CsgG/HfaB family protein [Halomonas sp. PAR7]MDT0510760.1 CsgG/HfaB family protein [Halomonas sp. LES1]MDT0591711.1 CsgG/HfaB family protein [Halomonas sp. PAR8]